MTQTVTVWRAPTTTDHRNTIRDWANAVSHVVDGCSVQPATGSANRVGREAITTKWVVYAPDGADVLASDRVEVNGTRYDVDGSIRLWQTGVLDHVEIPLKDVEG